MVFQLMSFLVVFCVGISNAYTLSGYFCPQCNATTDPNSLISSININYNRINIAFINWDNDGNIINEFDDSSKKFTLTPNMVKLLQTNNNAQVLISIGGADGSELNCDSNNSFVDNLIDNIVNLAVYYGFDGVDFNIEHRNGDYVKCAQIINTVMTILNQRYNLLITMSPQMPNLNPYYSTIEDGTNELAPLVSMLNDNGVFTYIQPQMYNAWSAAETIEYAEYYVKELVLGYNVTTNDTDYFVQVPCDQLLLGYPASLHGAFTGYIDPKYLKIIYNNLKSQNYEIEGFMTWSIGWDQQNNWNFANTLGNLQNNNQNNNQNNSIKLIYYIIFSCCVLLICIILLSFGYINYWKKQENDDNINMNSNTDHSNNDNQVTINLSPCLQEINEQEQDVLIHNNNDENKIDEMIDSNEK